LLQERHAGRARGAGRGARDRAADEEDFARLDHRPARRRRRYHRDEGPATAALALRRPLRLRQPELYRVAKLATQDALPPPFWSRWPLRSARRPARRHSREL